MCTKNPDANNRFPGITELLHASLSETAIQLRGRDLKLQKVVEMADYNLDGQVPSLHLSCSHVIYNIRQVLTKEML